MPDYYTWSQFKDAVKKLCPLDSIRKGVGTSAEDFFEGNLRQAVIHIQSVIEQFRLNHETVYQLSDFVQEDKALRSVKPPESIIRDVFMARTTDEGTADQLTQRFSCVVYDWKDRFDLVHGNEYVDDNRPRIAIDPAGYTFYLYPAPPSDDTACWVVSMFWDGLKLNFKDCEQTPFNEMMAACVANYIKAQIALDVEKSKENYEVYMGQFNRMKPLLYVNEKEKAALKG